MVFCYEFFGRTVWRTAKGRSFALHHMGVKLRRPAHRLAGIVDYEIELGARGEQSIAKRFDTRRMAHIESEDLQTMSPLIEIRLLCIALRRVAREASGDYQLCSRAQQLQSSLITDLYAAAGQERH